MINPSWIAIAIPFLIFILVRKTKAADLYSQLRKANSKQKRSKMTRRKKYVIHAKIEIRKFRGI